MANVTSSSPIMHQDKTVYASAGSARTVLGLAEEHRIPIPFDCQNGDCGSCQIEVEYYSPGSKMGLALTEKEKSKLKELGKLTAADIEAAEVKDMPPRWRLACQFVARAEDVRIIFSGAPGGAA
ncbi:2Fe-2S iron-sulfur cluster-binding protein [Mangrovicoccus ximenensis]|uniref:2Fe-2S iron-sulfur cluster-binding protein n=1 Tax=Mangrovicoccus ximenensis TaxID=1911570 RepID=UPI000D358986|nr:2Fe-2S iron-sulfur cluster binding domain-containing protein [Mangrovicoccus ximenensis]